MAGGIADECTFYKCIIKTIERKAPWSYYGKQMTPEDLRIMCNQFPDFAMREEGFGDLSIIRSYEQFKAETPAISHIRIWSKDVHLQAYDEEIHMSLRRNGERI